MNSSVATGAARARPVLARGKFRHRGRFRVRACLTAAGRRRLRHATRVRVVATIVVRPKHGRRTRVVRPILLRRARKAG